MSKRKGWINKKTAVRFEVLGRKDGSDLAPVDDRAQSFLEDHNIEGERRREDEDDDGFYDDDDDDDDDEAYVDDEETLNTLPKRGYDYSQHLKDTGGRGGYFISREGAVVPSEQRPELDGRALSSMYADETALLEEMHGRRVESLNHAEDAALSADAAEVQALLENFDENNVEPMDDDFLRQLREDTRAQGVRAKYAQSKQKVNFDDDELPPMEEGEDDSDTDEEDALPKPKGKGKETKGKKKSLMDIEDDDDDDDDDDDGEEVDEDAEWSLEDEEDGEDYDEESDPLLKKMRMRDPRLRYQYDPQASDADLDKTRNTLGSRPPSKGQPQPQKKAGAVGDDMLDVALSKFDADMFEADEGSEEDEDMVVPHKVGAVPASAFNRVFDEFLKQGKHNKVSVDVAFAKDDDDDAPPLVHVDSHKESREVKPPKERKRKEGGESGSESASEEEEEEEEEVEEEWAEEMELLRVRREVQWDAESVLSTYSNTDNHPSLLKDEAPTKRIRVNRKGIAALTDVHEDEEGSEEEEEEERPNKGTKRVKGETAEEKKARKQAAKAERQERRMEKKELKTAFKAEELRQRQHKVGRPMDGRTLIKF